MRQSDIKFTATYSECLEFGNYSLFTLYDRENNRTLLKFILALLNSRALTFYGLQKDIILIKKGKTPQIRSGQRGPVGIRQLPIPEASEQEQTIVVKKSQGILDLNKELQSTPVNTGKYDSLKQEIEKLDREIDEEIYKLYDLTPEEIGIVENSSK